MPALRHAVLEIRVAPESCAKLGFGVRLSGHVWLAACLLALGLFVVGAGSGAADGGTPPSVTLDSVARVVTWDTGDGTPGQLWVSVDNAPEDFVGEAAQGSNDVAWVSTSKHYAFSLYAGRDHALRLAGAVLEPTTDPEPPAVPVLPRGIERLVELRFVPPLLFGLALLSRGRSARLMVVVALIWALLPVLASLPAPLPQQPFPDSQEYADAAYQLVHGNGYVTTVHGHGPEPPRYPPGFSLALTPFAALGDYPANVAVGARAFAVLYVVITAAAAWRLGGPTASALTLVLIGSSPFALVSSRLVLSDALAAALTVPLVLLIQTASTRRAALAGGLGSLLMTIRLSAGLALPALFLAVPGRMRWALVAGAAPLILALGTFQWYTFGSPLRTGYDYWPPGVSNFSLAYATVRAPFGDGPWIVSDRLNGLLMRWVCPCVSGGPQATVTDVQLYPAVLLGLFWVFTPPLITLVGLAYLWRKRGDAGARFTLAQMVLSLVFYCVYYYQGSRFMAAPATVLAIYSGVGIAYWARQPVARAWSMAGAVRTDLNAVRRLVPRLSRGAGTTSPLADAGTPRPPASQP
jgi:hypothetical protein